MRVIHTAGACTPVFGGEEEKSTLQGPGELENWRKLSLDWGHTRSTQHQPSTNMARPAHNPTETICSPQAPPNDSTDSMHRYGDNTPTKQRHCDSSCR
jgi:hypothetical protein